MSEASPHIQQPLPLAFIHGEAVLEKPEDLYIPPDALEVILEAFEGPLDFLLYLIRKHKMEIVDLPVFQITRQYVEYVELMSEMKLELAAEYLLMSAMLAEIKSRMLLPRIQTEEDEEVDPRAELIRRLQEYEALKQAAQKLDETPRTGRDFFIAHADTHPDCEPIKIQPKVKLQELVVAFQKAMETANAFEHHHIAREALSTRERMSKILEQLSQQDFLTFEQLFLAEEGRGGVVVSFLAILELVKESLIKLVQAQPYGVIHLRRHQVDESEIDENI